ncbi:unnamed protein product [Microthlaspi erraticum]|uniref:Transcription initiation factor IIF subunit alpha n=1 Tax=Microthlaspi erraticum TaxID=1685480 RepID=A0A6D2L348_9BRAS|nr:unnamed protein product [Microthlaspi erraticum]
MSITDAAAQGIAAAQASAAAQSSFATNPYQLNASDNPGSLKEDNYSTELRNSLQAKQKLGFIDGTITKPAADPELSTWLASNSMIIGWIRTSIDPKIRSTVSFVSEASTTLWKSLQARFSVGNLNKHESESLVKEEEINSVSKSNVPTKAVKPEPASAASTSAAATGAVTEDEIRAFLMEKKKVTTQDLVSRFKARLKTKEEKNGFADILRRISQIQKNAGSQNFVVLRKRET